MQRLYLGSKRKCPYSMLDVFQYICVSHSACNWRGVDKLFVKVRKAHRVNYNSCNWSVFGLFHWLIFCCSTFCIFPPHLCICLGLGVRTGLSRSGKTQSDKSDRVVRLVVCDCNDRPTSLSWLRLIFSCFVPQRLHSSTRGLFIFKMPL